MTGYDSDGVDLTGGGMDPDHPLLARAQAALRKQLEDRKRDVEERIREKEAELNVRPHPRPYTYPRASHPRSPNSFITRVRPNLDRVAPTVRLTHVPDS